MNIQRNTTPPQIILTARTPEPPANVQYFAKLSTPGEIKIELRDRK